MKTRHFWIKRVVSVAICCAAWAAGVVHAETGTGPSTESSPAPMKLAAGEYRTDELLNKLAVAFSLTIIQKEALPATLTIAALAPKDAAEAADAMSDYLSNAGFTIHSTDAENRVWQIVRTTPVEIKLGKAAVEAQLAEQNPPTGSTKTMAFEFVDTPVETVLNEVTSRLGIEIDRAVAVPGTVTIRVPHPVDAEEAVRLLNSILAPTYTTISLDREDGKGHARPAVRVGTFDELKKGAIPVR